MTPFDYNGYRCYFNGTDRNLREFDTHTPESEQILKLVYHMEIGFRGVGEIEGTDDVFIQPQGNSHYKVWGNLDGGGFEPASECGIAIVDHDEKAIYFISDEHGRDLPRPF